MLRSLYWSNVSHYPGGDEIAIHRPSTLGYLLTNHLANVLQGILVRGVPFYESKFYDQHIRQTYFVRIPRIVFFKDFMTAEHFFLFNNSTKRKHKLCLRNWERV